MNIENGTSSKVSYAVARTVEGEEALLLIAKNTFAWNQDGSLTQLEDGPDLVEADVFTGEDGVSSLAYAAENGPPKPRLDVYMTGKLSFPEPQLAVDCSLQVGAGLRKTLRVFGDRVWQKGRDGRFVASRPQPFSEMPLIWERAYGGVSAQDPKLFEPRNPTGLWVQGPSLAEGQPLPNFELPEAPIQPGQSATPAGFGAIAPHWEPRSKFAGTYDDNWKQTRAPLPPRDFDPLFFNVAPADQQLPAYVAGDTVVLVNLTGRRQETFKLPPIPSSVTLIDDGYLVERKLVPDTVSVDLDKRLITVRAALQYVPRHTVLDVVAAVVGPLSQGRRNALQSGKTYAKLRDCKRKPADSGEQP